MAHRLLRLFTIASIFSTAFSLKPNAYANDFVDPGYILSNSFGDDTRPSRDSIQTWAKTLASRGPWSEPLAPGLFCSFSVDKIHIRRCEQIRYTTFRQQARLHELGAIVRPNVQLSGKYLFLNTFIISPVAAGGLIVLGLGTQLPLRQNRVRIA
jgi:hypothetical protein